MAHTHMARKHKIRAALGAAAVAAVVYQLSRGRRATDTAVGAPQGGAR